MVEYASDQDASDWEIEEGIPQSEDPFLQQYFAGREALIEREKSQRSDEAFRHSLTPMAMEACDIVSRIIAEERQTVWTRELQHGATEQEKLLMYPGMAFHLARDVMESTKSWKIVKEMPKGALLHSHLDATMNVASLIEQALKTEGMAISANQSLHDEQARKAPSVLFRFQKVTGGPGSSIWTSEYQPFVFVPLKEAADAFPGGGLQGCKAWITSLCTISPEESLRHYHGVDAIWKKFVSCFSPLNSLLNYEPILRASISKVLTDLNNDGIRWADFRSVFAADFFVEGSEEPSIDFTDFLRVWDEELKVFKDSEAGAHFWGCRFIWTTLREWDRRQVVDHMKACVKMKKRFPELICGFDCVGHEDSGRTLADLTPELFWFRKLCAENGVEIPFFFHAGECLGDGDKVDQNLFDAILLGSRRIGHGFSLFKHPLLIEMVLKKRILIECCPISNEVLRLTSSIKGHPLPSLLARGVPCCLSNDDPGVLGYGTSGVTHDFWQALQGWENVGLEGLGSMAENSVRWACYGDQATKEWHKDVGDGKHGSGVRANRMRQWMDDWNKFCEWIVKEFAIDYGGDL